MESRGRKPFQAGTQNSLLWSVLLAEYKLPDKLELGGKRIAWIAYKSTRTDWEVTRDGREKIKHSGFKPNLNTTSY